MINIEGLQARFPGRDEFIIKLFHSLLAGHSTAATDLNAAVNTEDLESIAFLAHRVKGAAGNIMAESVFALAEKTELSAKNNEPDSMQLASQLSEQVALLLQEIERHINLLE
ncbi:MAG: Hpt domain-containing protein [Gammaproteobacteria bacterium]|nr:Hpt domain-containing protein [Gammaproteobacteria bacterium]